MENPGIEKATHQAHRDALAKYFEARQFRVVRWQELERLVGRCYQQRVSTARRELKMNIENVKRFIIIRDAEGKPHAKRATGDYRYRPNALARDAADFSKAMPQSLFHDQSGWQQR